MNSGDDVRQKTGSTHGMPDQNEQQTYRIDCPKCSWQSQEFQRISGELSAEVDAGLHYVEEHGGRIPEHAEFGNKQCPSCHDVLGLNGTASCSECGFVPEPVRVKPTKEVP